MVPVIYNIRNLIERKGTTLMTAVGIGLTVAVLIMALALADGLRSTFAASGDERQVLVLRKGTNAELTSSVTSDAYQIIRPLPGIAKGADGEPLVSPEGLAVVSLMRGDSPMNVTVRGILPVGLTMREVKIERGQMFNPGLRQIMVGQAIAKKYPEAQIGKKVRFGRGEWEVVGVFSSGDSAFNSEIWVDLNQLRGDFEQAGGSSSLLIRAESKGAVEDLQKRIDGDQRLGVQTMKEKEYFAKQTEAGLPLQILGYAVAVIMAVGSAFAATNTMYAAVARRSREIGTLRALGFSRFSILVSFIVESACLALLGGVVGVLLALPAHNLSTNVGSFTTFSDIAFKFKVSAGAVVAGLVFAAVIGALGGLLPAWAAARKDIVQAMREI